MKLLMHITKKNKKLGIDNESISNEDIQSKLSEEYLEVMDELKKYRKDRTLGNLKNIIRETFDLIQVCILILWRAHRQAKDFDEADLIEEINIEHKNKLTERGWSYENGIRIEIGEKLEKEYNSYLGRWM